VTALTALYRRLEHLVHEILRFGLVGILALLLDLALFNALLVWSGQPLTSKALATAVATTAAFFGNRHYTFAHRRGDGRVRRAYLLFFLLNGVGLGIALCCLAVSHYLLGFTSQLADNIAANGVGLVLGTVFRFWSYRTFVFPHVPAAEAVGPAVTGVPSPPS
jgi:putative flippase GtrA